MPLRNKVSAPSRTLGWPIGTFVSSEIPASLSRVKVVASTTPPETRPAAA